MIGEGGGKVGVAGFEVFGKAIYGEIRVEVATMGDGEALCLPLELARKFD